MPPGLTPSGPLRRRRPQTTGARPPPAPAAGRAALTVLVVGTGGGIESEGHDRSSLSLPPAQQDLLDAVRAAVARTAAGQLVVVVVSAGPVYIDPAGIDALVYAGYPGEEAGHGVTDVVFGRVSPSARFPLTVYAADYLSKVGPVSDFSSTSGVGRTYRYLNTTASPPLFSFGFGLSYSTFRYADLAVTPTADGGVNVTAMVTNTGAVAAHEVAQLYVAVPGAGAAAPLPIPTRSLQGFARPFLTPGATERLAWALSHGQLHTVQADGTATVTPGMYTFSVGGRQPADLNPAGVAQGNVVEARLTIPAV